ncbi:hypothetical protein KOR42_32950 [Thalassoglobus neptunius]|uniref:Uncharacterized protein n=1 Tax=Thalassoglobus neptunius TaxID=1938619 RepID=A0A5C5WPP1_9PLAN|nr:hypothetical protein KOR42_32950 [Thalassoglobus neptunius]
MTNSCEKGKRGERELSKELNRILPCLSMRRGQQYNGIEGEDVVGWPGVHVECKRVEKLNLEKALKQSADDATIEDVPIVCHRKNRGSWIVSTYLDYLPELAKRVSEASEEEEIEELGQEEEAPEVPSNVLTPTGKFIETWAKQSSPVAIAQRYGMQPGGRLLGCLIDADTHRWNSMLQPIVEILDMKGAERRLYVKVLLCGDLETGPPKRAEIIPDDQGRPETYLLTTSLRNWYYTPPAE